MSDWKIDASKRRDARNARSPGETPKPATANAKKNTRKWCRGKVGIEHQPKCVDHIQTKGWSILQSSGAKLLVCTACGKELDRYWPIGPWESYAANHPPPDWAR